MKVAEKILEQINAGSWEVKHEEKCTCNFKWFMTSYDELVHVVEEGDCWERNTLLVKKKQVIMREGDDVRYSVKGIHATDIPRSIWSALYIPSRDNRWDWPGNDTHSARRREALIKFLLSCGYELDRYYPRDFGNEYVMILREHEIAWKNTREECEKWADGFLYRGDAATHAYVGFHFSPCKGKL